MAHFSKENSRQCSPVLSKVMTILLQLDEETTLEEAQGLNLDKIMEINRSWWEEDGAGGDVYLLTR